MKTKILICFLACLFSFNVYSKGDIKINGIGFKSFKNVALKIYDPSTLSYKTLKKIELSKEGNFTIKTQFNGVNLYELNFDEKDFIHLSIENDSDIKVIRNGIETSILGSLSSQKIIDFEKENETLQAKYFGQLKRDVDKAISDKNQEEIDRLQKQAEVAIQNFLIEFRALIVSLGTTPAAFYAIQYSDFNKELNFIESRFHDFKKEIPNASITLALEKQINNVKSIAIGNIAPELNTVDKFGNKISLANFKGKVLLIDFWAYWCRACRIENPKLVAIYNFYKPKGFDIISISQKSTMNQWESAIQKDGIGYWTQVLDQNNRLSDLYGISSLPQNLLLDESGRIIAKNISAKELEEILSNKVGNEKVLKPELLKFGASTEDLIIRLTPLCDSIIEKKNEPIQLPTVVNSQSQLDCYGFMYAGKKRKVELIFADNYLDMIWILTDSDEEGGFIKEFKNHFGEPTHIKSDAVFFINNGAAVRNKPHEIMFISERLYEPYKQWLNNN